MFIPLKLLDSNTMHYASTIFSIILAAVGLVDAASQCKHVPVKVKDDVDVGWQLSIHRATDCFDPTESFHGILYYYPVAAQSSKCTKFNSILSGHLESLVLSSNSHHAQLYLFSDKDCDDFLDPGFDIKPLTSLNKMRSLPSSVHNATAFYVFLDDTY
ncbi:hypothetical protein BJ138DRAFT_1149232 [Hygrophoropsis aurantiaca]|uniref:Uncharacterized protein n=1 Tax=Hygrophoropsis aurantiaca TaxID=72124 RepID=A0ACB8AGG0_9AGAM|nr:hypothetical protein BJ138DRAFT_1149232 [Hygrophoropsis aurantiaca]